MGRTIDASSTHSFDSIRGNPQGHECPIQPMAEALVIIQTTLPGTWTEAEVGIWVQALFDANLLACAHVDAVRSIYRWEEKLHSENEWRLQLKTTVQGTDSLRSAVSATHPYEVPELITIEATASNSYADWLQKEVN